MFENIRKSGPRSLTDGVIYGSGLILGGILGGFLFNIITLERLAHLDGAVRLIIGLLSAFVITALSGAVSGFLGGYSLPLIGQSKGGWGNAWRSAISMGVTCGLSLYPIILALSLISYFTEEAPASGASVGVTLVGAVFGILVSLLMGFLSIGKRGYASLVWAGAPGFGFGGAVLGFGLWAYVMSIRSAGVDSGSGYGSDRPVWVWPGRWIGLGLCVCAPGGT